MQKVAEVIAGRIPTIPRTEQSRYSSALIGTRVDMIVSARCICRLATRRCLHRAGPANYGKIGLHWFKFHIISVPLSGMRMIAPVSSLHMPTKSYCECIYIFWFINFTTSPPSSPYLYAATSQVVQAGSAGKHWYTERVAAVGLLALIPAGFIYPNPVVDYGLAVLIPLHGHWSVSVECNLIWGCEIAC